MIQTLGFVAVPLSISEPSLLMASTAVYASDDKAHFHALHKSSVGVTCGLQLKQTTWGTRGELERYYHSRWLIRSRTV